MTEEERRKMVRENYAAQLASMGYGPDGMALPPKEPEAVSPVICGDARTFEESRTFFYTCGVCGKPLNFDNKFCPNCGKPVKWDGK